ncbi:hypothetical protein KI387_026819, partial [Taxus chinensis]
CEEEKIPPVFSVHESNEERDESLKGTHEGDKSEEEVETMTHESAHLSGEKLEDTVEKEVTDIIKYLVEHEVERSIGEVWKHGRRDKS